jgi:tight adherence protein B
MSDSVLPAVIAALTFLSAALALDGLVNWWREKRAPAIRRVRNRISRMSSSGSADPLETVESVVRARTLSRIDWLNPYLERLPGLDSVDRLIKQANLKWTAGRFLAVSVFPALAAFVVIALFFGQPNLAFLIAAALLVLPWMIAQRMQERRLKRFILYLPEALDSLSRALKAGYSMAGALKIVAEEMPDPLGPEFAQAHDEITYGIAAHVALNNLLERIPSDDLKFMVVAILVQRETGGNLAEVLGNIARMMRERQKLNAQVRSLSADGRMSAVVLCLLPVVTIVLMFLMQREFIEVLWMTRAGQIMMMVAGVMMAVGIFWVRLVVQVRF